MSINKVLMQQLQSNGSYNQIYPQVDAYSKSETLTNDTSQMFRLNNGTPEQVMQYLGKYAQYWWKKEILAHYDPVRVLGSGSIYTTTIRSTNTVSVYYSASLNQNGQYFVLDGSSYVSVSYRGWVVNQEILQGKYISFNFGDRLTQIFYLPSNVTLGWNELGGSKYSFDADSFETITTKYVDTQFFGYVQSNNRNAYPDSGEQDGYNYTYLGVPLSNAALLTISDKL